MLDPAVALGVERRGEVDEVNGFSRDLVAQNPEVVAEEQLIYAGKFSSLRTAAAGRVERNPPYP